jgi:hypothetical protein
MGNPFKGVGHNLHGLVYDMVPVTPNDSTDNVGSGNVAIGLYVTVSGNVTFLTKDGVERTIAVPNNFYLVCSVSRVKSTGTTATGIHAMVV